MVNNTNEDFAFVIMSFDNHDKLYFHNRSNPNSVCATLRNIDIHEIFKNNLLIITMGCLTSEDFYKKISKKYREKMIDIHLFCINKFIV